MMKLLMPARGRWIALRAALVPVTTGGAAVANGIPAGDDTVLARASSARITGRRQSLSVLNFLVLEPTTYA